MRELPSDSKSRVTPVGKPMIPVTVKNSVPSVNISALWVYRGRGKRKRGFKTLWFPIVLKQNASGLRTAWRQWGHLSSVVRRAHRGAGHAGGGSTPGDLKPNEYLAFVDWKIREGVGLFLMVEPGVQDWVRARTSSGVGRNPFSCMRRLKVTLVMLVKLLQSVIVLSFYIGDFFYYY